MGGGWGGGGGGGGGCFFFNDTATTEIYTLSLHDALPIWRDYQETGAVCGVVLPKGLELASKLEQPIFTPSTKAAAGTHDENVNFESVCREIGFETANKIRCVSLFIFSYARYYAERCGIIIADTKLEFGTDNDGTLYLIDEIGRASCRERV